MMASLWETRVSAGSQTTFSAPRPFSIRAFMRSIMRTTPDIKGWYRSPPTLPYNIFEQDEFDLACLRALRAPGFYAPPKPLPVRQGNSVTNIYGNDNRVTTDVGANGWTPTVNTSVGDNPMASSTDTSTPPTANMGGSSTAQKSNVKVSGSGNSTSSKYTKWWEPAAAKGLERGIDHAINLGDKVVGGAASAIGAGVDKLKGKLAGPGPAKATNLLATDPSANLHGNTEIQTQAPSCNVLAYPPTPAVPLPNPDLPSEPGPSGDRAWLLDTFTWYQDASPGMWIAGKNAFEEVPLTYPPSTGLSNKHVCYHLPWAMVMSQPDSVWSMMYKNHSYWNSGFRIQLTVNGSQFHSGTLILAAFPEGTGQGGRPFNSVFTYPYALLNLTTGNTCTLELPYISLTPNSSTSFLHAPWTVAIIVLTPLTPPTGSPQQLQCSLYCTPLNSSFYGLRYPDQQHIKTRNVPGSGAFGTAVSGQEMPLVGVNATRPPVDYLPGEVHDWLEFASRPGLFNTSYWTMADEPGLLLASAPVSPDSLAAVSTPIGFALTLFSQWRGELKLQLLFTGSAQHYGRLAVCYTPPAPQPPKTMQQAMHGTYVVWDINGNSTLDFTIPFMSQSYWKTVDIATPNGLIGNNGFITVWVMNPLSGPSNAPPSATVQSFIFAGDTFRLRFQQAPALGWQAGDEAPAALDNLENGVPDTHQSEQPTFNWTNSDMPPDTNLQNFFSFFRYWPLADGGQPLPLQIGAVEVMPLDPAHNLKSDVLQMLSAFTYFTADLRINFRVICSVITVPTTFCVGFIPAGATVPPGIGTPLVATSSLSDFTLVDQPIPSAGSYELSVSIPYTSPQSVLATTFNGWETWNGQNFGQLHSNTWGTLIFYSVGQTQPGPANANSLQVSAWISLGGFRGFCARSPPGLGPLPEQSMVRTGNACALARVGREEAYARRQGLDEDDYFEDLPEEVEECESWNPDSGTFLEDKVYVVRCQRPTYVHWAIRYVRWDGYTKQISLQNAGLRSIIGYEEPEGEPVQEVELHYWEQVRLMVGCPYPYNAHSNCSTFISDLTGYPCENTGLSLGAGLAVLGAASIAAGTLCAQTRKARRQGLGDLAAASKVITQPNVDQAFRIAGSGIRAADKLSDSLTNASNNLLRASENVNLDKVIQASANIESAAERIATSVEGATDTINNLQNLFAPPGQPNIFTKFFTWLARIFGYLLILFGSPTPMSIAGLLMVICADLAPYAGKIFQKAGDIGGSIFHWIATKLGYDVTPEDSADAAAGLVDIATDGAAQQGGLDDFNKTVTAMKNTDWLLDKIVTVIEKLLNWLEKKAGDDPKTTFSNNESKYMELYADSIKAVSSPPNLIDPKAISSNMDLARKLHDLAISAKATHHASLATQAIKNYSQISGRSSTGNPGSRAEPVVVYIHGPPGCGKSVIASLLASTLATKLGKGPDDYYAPSSPDCQYYDGYTGQPVHYIDDIGQDPEGRDWSDFVNLVSTAPFIVPMASLEQKGTYYTSDVIICTSNFAGPNERSARSLSAIERRLLMRLEVKPEGGIFDIDSALTPCGPQSKHFTHETPLTRLEANNVSFSVRSQISCTLNTLDDLVDFILEQVAARKRHHTSFAKLIRQGGSDQDPPGSVRYTAVASSVEDEVTQQIKMNLPPKEIEKKIEWKQPLFCTAAFLSVLASVVAIFYYVRKIINEKKQGAYSGMPNNKEKEKEKPKLKPKNVKVMTASAHRQGDLSPAIPNIAQNVVRVGAIVGGESMVMSGLFVASRYMVTATHLVVRNDETASEIMVDGTTHSLSEIPWAIDGELAIFRVPGREYKSLTRFLTKTPNYKHGFLISSILSGHSYIRVSNAKECPLHIEDVIDEENALLYECSSFPGLCGSPLVLTDPSGIRIASIHVAGVTGYSGMGCRLSPDRWSNMVAALADKHSKIIPIPLPGPPTHIQRHTQLKPSPAHGAFPVVKGPAVLSRGDPRLDPLVDFDTQVFVKHDRGDITEPWPNLVEAFDLYFSHFPDEIRSLSQHEAINGTPGLDGIDMNQSPGYPWVAKGRSRRSLFTETPDGYVPKPELQLEIDKVLEDPKYYYTTSLKDELRPDAKVKAGGTRLIEAAPIQAIVVGRMIFGGLFEHMHANPGKYGSAVGCNPDYHWTQFFWQFSEYEEVFDLDYKGFDATLPTCCFDLMAKHLAKRIGHPLVEKYIQSVSHSQHVYGNRAYEMVGGNPSGCVGTSIFNTIINNCAVISAMMAHPDFSPTGFLILAYGDDVIYSHSPTIHPSHIKSFYDEHTTLEVTPASKSGTFPETSSIYTVTFLKRWFVPDECRPMYIHPVIDPTVYEQSVMWLRTGDFTDVLTSLSYLAHHSGPNNYEKWCTAVRDKCKSVGVKVTFLPYSVLQMGWLKLVST
uniref:Genome polyprotein n=1 Tax=Coleura bat picornavirus TaxID=3141868 RepID=A0AAU7E2P6_9VIRU